MEEKKCSGDHSRHLCMLAFERKFNEIKHEAKNPRFICMNCGRVSQSNRNLCNPEAF